MQTHNIKGYKKIDVEEYRLVEHHLDSDDRPMFDGFPSDGLWLVHSKKNSKSTKNIMDIKKFKENPETYPLVDLALRQNDICSAIVKFTKEKNKALIDFGKVSYSYHELSEYIIKYLVNQELGGGSKKVLIEKKWIKTDIEERKNEFGF